MVYIDWLGAKPYEPAHAGGKGASLSLLAQGGFDVPAGFVINTEASQDFLAAAGLDAEARRNIDLRLQVEPEAVRNLSTQLQRTVLGTAMPEELREQVRSGYAELSRRHGPAVAVRSSATGEDGAASSFAGLFDTYLNLTHPESVIEAVQQCYASMWSERVLRYYLRRGVESNVAMAVVVMQMVPADVSGVVFTAHPVTGDLEQVVINATWGLGDAIVSGSVTPDTYVFAKETLALLERETSVKEVGVFPAGTGSGVIETDLDLQRASTASLNEDAAREVARIACRVEDYFGCPQDIEFAITAGQVYLLQSRPITTI